MGLFSSSRKSPSSPARRRETGVRTRALEARDARAAHTDQSGSQVFRRNRTLSNAEKAPINSISPRAMHHHLRRRRRSLGLLLVGSLTVVCLLTFVLYQFSGQFTVALYGSLGTIDETSQASYRQTIDDYLRTRPGERLRLLLNVDELRNYLQANGHYEVASVTAATSTGLGQTRLEIKAREPVAQWVVDDSLQYVDNQGVVFTQNFYATPSIKIVDESGITVNSATVTSGRFLAFIGRVIGALDDFGYGTKEVIIPPDMTRQVQLRVENGSIVKFAVDRPAGEQAEDAARTLDYMRRRNTTADYIDVRVSGRAYYK